MHDVNHDQMQDSCHSSGRSLSYILSPYSEEQRMGHPILQRPNSDVDQQSSSSDVIVISDTNWYGNPECAQHKYDDDQSSPVGVEIFVSVVTWYEPIIPDFSDDTHPDPLSRFYQHCRGLVLDDWRLRPAFAVKHCLVHVVVSVLNMEDAS